MRPNYRFTGYFAGLARRAGRRDTDSSSRLSLNRDSNNLGFLRLLFASLVIFSHSPQLIDGNRSREILSRAFGTLSFGDLAVDGFFLISGYLIIASYERSKTRFEYLVKRILRIYPGFIVACAFAYLIGWISGGRFTNSIHLLIERVGDLILLNAPSMVGAFPKLPYHAIDGSMWTIGYEFRCYLLVILLGYLGLFRRRYIYLCLTAIVLLIYIVGYNINYPGHISLFVGNFRADFRLIGVFLCGGLFLLFRDKIAYTKVLTIVSVIVLIPLMFSYRLVDPALALLGGYILFWFAFHSRAGILSRIDNRVDLSYGIYLYAWPLQQLVLWRFGKISPWTLTAICLVLSAIFAYFSWTFVEKPFMRMKNHLPANLNLYVLRSLLTSGRIGR